MSLSTGQILNNRYRIEDLLGQGGFGAVYQAWDINFEVPCAVKENTESNEAAQRQFVREARLLHTLRHPNLPLVNDYFILPGQGQYLVMDFVEGDDLEEKLKRTRGPLRELLVLDWIGQVCDALIYLHSQKPPVIHRDIKPANIKVTPEGIAKLVDFGIAKIFNPDLTTSIGARAYTPGYAPPEQYGKATTDAQSDVYALGATMYTLLTGKLPPDSVDIMTHCAPPPIPVHMINKAISPELSKAIEKAMSLDRAQRWHTVAEFKATIISKSPPTQLESISKDTIVFKSASQHSQTVSDQATRPIPSGRASLWTWIMGLGVLIFVCIVILGFTIWGMNYLIKNRAVFQLVSTEVVEATHISGIATQIPSGMVETAIAIMPTMQSVVTKIAPTFESKTTQVYSSPNEVPPDIPIMPGEISAFVGSPQAFSYVITADFNQVVNFYKTEMPSKGWTAMNAGGESSSMAPGMSNAELNFQMGNRKATVVITEIPFVGQTTVVINLENQ